MSLPDKAEIGQYIRHRRLARHMSLQQMSAATGLSITTLSKIENNLIELSYTRMIAISEALGINLTELVSGTEVGNTPSVITARRSVNRVHEGSVQDDGNYQSRYINTDISKKQMIPAVVTVKHRTIEEFGPMSKHKGEELILVLRGEVEFHSEHYNPVRLSEGESVYIDSTMPHAIISVGEDLAEILSVCTHEIPRMEEGRSADARQSGRAAHIPPKSIRSRSASRPSVSVNRSRVHSA